jgi:biotin carboxyl carrier protein
LIYRYLDGEDIRDVEVFIKKQKVQLDLDGEKWDVEVQKISPNCLCFHNKNQTCHVFHAEKDGKQYLSIEGECYCFKSLEPSEEGEPSKRTNDRNTQSQLILSAPMPGNLLKINVREGDPVEEGQCLAVIEAMKMETGLHSTVNASVKKVYANVGHQVEAGEKLIELEQDDPIIQEGDENTC